MRSPRSSRHVGRTRRRAGVRSAGFVRRAARCRALPRLEGHQKTSVFTRKQKSAVPGPTSALTQSHRQNPAVVSTALPPSEGHDSPAAIFVRFLKFGALAWGGPAAQIAMIKHECVDEEGWVSEASFKKTLAVFQILPGPEAHELCVYFGRLRGGKLGGFLAGLGFMLPGFLLMLGLSILYVEASLATHLDQLFYGLTAAVGALVARALVRLSQTFISDVPLAAIAVIGFVLTYFVSLSFALVLLGSGLASDLW